jgi:hypothetical protein
MNSSSGTAYLLSAVVSSILQRQYFRSGHRGRSRAGGSDPHHSLSMLIGTLSKAEEAETTFHRGLKLPRRSR